MSSILLTPLAIISFELFIGAATGLISVWMISFFTSHRALLGLVTGAIFLTAGLALSFGLSPLLPAMMLGFVITNYCSNDKGMEAFEVIGHIEEAVFGIFFALAGAHLQLGVLLETSWLILLLSVGRFSGKLLGSSAGAVLTFAPANVKRYLAIALLPAAGVTIGLMLEANAVYSSTHPNLCETMVSAVVGATLLNELLTPFLVRFSLFKVGEAQTTNR